MKRLSETRQSIDPVHVLRCTKSRRSQMVLCLVPCSVQHDYREIHECPRATHIEQATGAIP